MTDGQQRAILKERSLFLTPRRLLRLILGVYLLLALAYSVIVPLGEAPDEVSHYAYVRWLATRQSLPEPEGAVLGEAFQPPLYYAFVAPLTIWQPDEGIPVVANADWELSDPRRGARVLIQPPAARWPWHGEALAWHLARFLSPLFGLVTVLATYGLGRIVFPHRPWYAPLAAAFVAFLPQFTFQSGVVTNDNLATMLSALLLLILATALVRTMEAGEQPLSAVGVWALAGLLGGLGIWTKSSGWVFVGTAGVAWLLTLRVPGRWRRGLALGGTWGVVAAPWLFWNQVRYGDPLGWSLMHQVTDERVGPLTWGIVRETALGLYRTFWVGFGGAAHLSLPPLANGILALFLLLALVGLGRFYLVESHRSPTATRWLLSWLGVHVLLVGLAWVQWTRTVLGTGQGRLLFSALPAIALLLAAGWSSVMGRPRRVALLGGGGSALLSAAALLLFLRPLYVAPPPQAIVQAEAIEVANWRFGEGLVLRQYAFPWKDSRQAVGARDEIYLEWEALRPLDDLRLRLQLLNRDDEMIWIKEGTPSAGHDTTDQWPVNRPVSAVHRVEIPPGTPAGWYRLMMSVHTAEGKTLPLYGPDGSPWGDQVMVGQIAVSP